MAANEALAVLLNVIGGIVLLYIGYRIFFALKLRAVKKAFFVELCPRCGSVERALKNGLIGITPVLYICKKCGYQGTFVEVEKDDVEEFRKEIKARSDKRKKRGKRQV